VGQVDNLQADCQSALPSVHATMTRLAIGLLLAPLLAGNSGPAVFAGHCAGCHGSDARGSGKGPGLAANPRLAGRSAAELRALIQRGFPDSGMPSFDLPAAELDAVATYVCELNAGAQPVAAPGSRRVTWRDPQPGDWLTYNGNLSANRYSELKQIDTANVRGLQLKWLFPIPHFGLEVTPLEADGVMYVTGPNQAYALDALTGTEIWKYSRPQTRGMVGDASLGTNRGVAIRGDRVFFVTDNAHLIALDRATGSLVWETAMPPMSDDPQHYGGTLAPLVVKDTVIAGVAGADEGIRGFVACYKAATGELVWRHWTVPRRGEPGSQTWKGREPVVGGGSTWLTGSYDPETDMLFWPTGNPFPDSQDAGRGGDNLYTDSILAMNPADGALKWHYQFTPHDVRDRDATEPPVLVNAQYLGKPRKLLLHADRNGFFYVLDRVTGELLLAKPFLRRVDWAAGVPTGPGADGRPQVKDPAGCPDDAANWSSTAYSPVTRLYYFLALEECLGSQMGYPDQTGQRYLRAVNIETGAIVWEIAQPGAAKAKSWSGVLATAGGLVFYGKPNGGFDAVDERSGETLWHFPTNVRMKASPMTFSVRGKQYVAVAAGPNILCFGL
jgi:PQQ-dependent dehydrogenase (methanol/ethanol family)